MITLHRLAAALLLAATPVIAEPQVLPPGLVSARLLPGWTDAAGDRVLALDLVLEPGWKTYWRSPGDSGLPPRFGWDGSGNLAGVTLHWPAPEAIRSGEATEMGYHDRLILPMTAHAADPTRPVDLAAQIELGLCEAICVPVALDLGAPPTGTAPDPVITTALQKVPQRAAKPAACTITDLPDGMRVAMALSGPAPRLAAIELSNQPDIWVSGATIGPGPWAVVDMVGPTARPFPIDPAGLVLTVIPADGSRAQEIAGCAP